MGRCSIVAVVRGLVALLVFLLAGAAMAQAGEGAAMTAVRLEPGEKIKLDGTLGHPAWQRAPVHSGFVEKDPNNGALPQHETRVQVLFGDHAIYVGITALDERPQQIRAPLVRHDGVNRTQDFVVLYLDPIGRRQSAQFFRVNAAGSTADGMHTAADDSEDFSPDFDFDAAVARNDAGYTAVIRVPFASLRYTSAADGNWRIMVARRVPREQFHLYTSSPIPLGSPSFIATLQPLRGIALPEKDAFLALRPSVTLRHERERTGESATRRSSDADAGLDVKWRPLPELVVDGALNPDFSQVALDVPQLAGNAQFALFFPEKRPFFFESSDLLRSPTDALYTRSVTRPRWGLRGTWRSERFAGTTFVADDRGGGFTLLPNAYGTGFAPQPGSRVLTARVRSDAGAMQWGGIAATRRYEDERGDNQVIGPDLGWQATDALRLRAQWLHSRTTALPGADGELARAPAESGNRVYVKLNHLTENTDADLSFDESSDGFRHDSGFVNQVGVRGTEAHYGHGWRRVGPLNELWFNLWARQVRAREGGVTVRQYLTPGVWMSAPGNSTLGVELHAWSRRRTAAQAPVLRDRYLYAEFSTTPARWWPLVEGNLILGRVSDIAANESRPGGRLNLSGKLRLLAPLELEPSVSVAWIRREGSLTYRESVLQLLGVWHFDAHHTLRAIVQRTALLREAEALVAASRDASHVGSLTYAWRRSVGTVLYVGASRGRSGLTDVNRRSEVFIKLQVDADEVRGLL
jgi:hypothetical protein